MRVGVVLPRSWIEPFRGITAAAAWDRVVSAAQTADRLGFAVRYLASGAAAFATGANHVVDGGYSLW